MNLRMHPKIPHQAPGQPGARYGSFANAINDDSTCLARLSIARIVPGAMPGAMPGVTRALPLDDSNSCCG